MPKITGMKLKWKPYSVIKADLGIQPGGKVHAFFTETCYRYMDKYVPMSDLISRGQLREDVDIGTDYITYNVPYASYQYFGIRQDGTHVVMNYTTPGTGCYWDELMWSAEGNDVVKEVQDYINRGGNK